MAQNKLSTELRQKRAALIQEMHDLTEKTSFPAEAEKRWNELDAEQKSLESQITKIEATPSLLADLDKVDHREKAQPGVTPENRADMTPAEQRAAKFNELRTSEKYNKSFDKWLRAGIVKSSFAEGSELRTYTGLEASTGAGENIVPIAFQKEYDKKLIAFGGMRRNARIINTSSGNPLDWPTVDDTANVGEWLSENSTVGQLNPSTGQVVFGSNVVDSKQVLVSVQLLQDSAFDVQALLVDLFGTRIARTMNAGYTTGTGSGQPTGLLHGVGSTGITNITLANGASSNNSTSSYTEINSIGTDDLGSLIASLDPAYRPNAKFMGHQGTFDFLRKVKDGFGRPIWSDSLSANVPDRIFGYSYDWNQDMSQIGAGNNELVFGDFSHYVIRDVGPLTTVIFNELYMSSLQKGYVAFQRTDGQLLQPAAFAVLQARLS